MTDRFTAHDYDAAWQVWDNIEQRSVGGSFTEAGALAEAARLNAQAPKRAKSVEAWAVVTPRANVIPATIRASKDNVPAAAEQVDGRHWGLLDAIGYRIARVRITEIEGGNSHG